MTWSAAQYVKFEHERTRPVHDLVARIPNAEVLSAADIGCGPGNSTEVLRERYPEARIVGLDSSPDMIEAARKRLPDIAFEVADIREWRPKAPLDVILANAVLQWIPDHETLFPALIAKLKPERRARGANARQSRRALASADGRGRKRTAPGRRSSRAPQARAPSAISRTGISAWLAPHAPHVDVWRTTYFHPLAGARPSSNG